MVMQCGPAPEEVAHTYFCNKPRMMRIASIDPSLAIAFYCRSLGTPPPPFTRPHPHLLGCIQ